MQTVDAFKCPHCAAPVPFRYGQYAAECEYCGSTVFVPSDLRPPPQPTQPTQPTQQSYSSVQIVIGSPGVYSQQPNALPAPPAKAVAPKRRRGACLPVLVFTIILLALSGGVIGFIASTVPFFFDNLFAGGFARLEQTYGSDPATPNTQGVGIGSVQDAVDVALDASGNIYVVTYDARVVRFAPDGEALGTWRIAGDEIQPDAIEADGVGNVYIAFGGTIGKYVGANGAEIKTITTGDMFGLNDVALAPDGSLLSFVGSTSEAIVRFDPTGREVARYNKPMTEYVPGANNAPWLVRIAADRQGRILLLNTLSNTVPVFVYSAAGKHIMNFGERGTGEGQLIAPSAIAADSKGRIYVADSNAIEVFSSEGAYIGIIHTPASFRPSGMAFDKQDRLYVVSRNEKKVYRFVLNAP